jgi:hypothetical protein
LSKAAASRKPSKRSLNGPDLDSLCSCAAIAAPCGRPKQARPNAAWTAEGSPGPLGGTPSKYGPQNRSSDRLAAQTIALTLRRKSLWRHGYRYEVVLDGEVIVSLSRDPEPDACRELLKRGLRGNAAFWREGMPEPCLVVDIERLAKLRTKDSNEGVRFVKFTPDGANTG